MHLAGPFIAMIIGTVAVAASLFAHDDLIRVFLPIVGVIVTLAGYWGLRQPEAIGMLQLAYDAFHGHYDSEQPNLRVKRSANSSPGAEE